MKCKIGIVIPILNNFEGFADLCLSIKTRHNYVVYVQPQWNHQIPLAAAWNKGAQQAFEEHCDFALVCNDDILFSPECIDVLVDEYNRLEKEKVIMVTPTNILGQVPNKYDILTYERPADQEITIADHPNFSCFLINPDYFKEIGTFDENFVPAWYEDNSSHRSAKLLGYREITTTAAHMVHIGHVTSTRMESPDSGPSQAYYIKKWGGIPESHPTQAQKEYFEHPYNNLNLKPGEWVPDYMGKLERGEINEQGEAL